MLNILLLHAGFVAALSVNAVIVYVQCFNAENGSLLKLCDRKGGRCSEMMFSSASHLFGIPLSLYSFSALASIYIGTIFIFSGFPGFLITFLGLLALVSGLLFFAQIIARKFCYLCNLFNALNVITFIISVTTIDHVSGYTLSQAFIWALIAITLFSALWALWKTYSAFIDLDNERMLWASIVRQEDPLDLRILTQGTGLRPSFGAYFPAVQHPDARKTITLCLSLDCEHCMDVLASLLDRRSALATRPVDLNVYFTCRRTESPSYFTLLNELKKIPACDPATFLERIGPGVLEYTATSADKQGDANPDVLSLMHQFERASEDRNEPDVFPFLLVDGIALPEPCNDVDFWLSVFFPVRDAYTGA
ncbi:hypothetical protein [Marinobacter sp. C2H3]|uniref:hypothetical protein n=1 Tax=Marinobacter sp. C2H3 TaxID=3119003 RepID=UPI00300EFE0C